MLVYNVNLNTDQVSLKCITAQIEEFLRQHFLDSQNKFTIERITNFGR